MAKKRLLVPVDGSRFAEASIPAAITLAERLDAELELVTVFFDEPVMADWDIPTADLEAFHKEYIEDAATRIRTTSSIDVTTTVLGGPVGETLERHAAGRSPDLVVISTHGRGPIMLPLRTSGQKVSLPRARWGSECNLPRRSSGMRVPPEPI